MSSALNTDEEEDFKPLNTENRTYITRGSRTSVIVPHLDAAIDPHLDDNDDGVSPTNSIRRKTLFQDAPRHDDRGDGCNWKWQIFLTRSICLLVAFVGVFFLGTLYSDDPRSDDEGPGVDVNNRVPVVNRGPRPVDSNEFPSMIFLDVDADGSSSSGTRSSSSSTISKSIKQEHEHWSKQLQHDTNMDSYPKDAVPDVNWNWEWHPKDRLERFPSVEERIKYYMGSWYNKTIPMYGRTFRKDTYIYQKTTREYQIYAYMPVNLHGLSSEALLSCYHGTHTNARDCLDTVDLAILHTHGTTSVIEHLGDGVAAKRIETDGLYPIINKVRYAKDPQTHEFVEKKNEKKRLDHILWPLTRIRHFTPTVEVPKADRPWHKKKSMAIWRGALRRSNVPTNKIKWNFVANHVNSTLVDAKFGKKPGKKYDDVPNKYLTKYTSMAEQLEYKYVISIEGNDVSTGLKWMLFSNSLLFLPPLQWESWAMEALLEPFVHFIPINSDCSNVEEMVTWAEANPSKAQKIAERGKLFIYDLFYHPQALHDEELVLQGIMDRFERNFGYSTQMSMVHPLYVHSNWHPKERKDRFPSVEERVEYYMGKWYTKQHGVNMARETFKHRLFDLTKQQQQPELGKEVVANGKALTKCASSSKEKDHHHHPSDAELLRRYCNDALPDFDERITTDIKSIALSHVDYGKKKLAVKASIGNEQQHYFDDSVKIIRFGDGVGEVMDVPVFGKTRHVLERKEEGESFSAGQSILWDFDYTNEFHLVESGLVEQNDIPFQNKYPRAIWRGGCGTKKKHKSQSTEFQNRLNLVHSSSSEVVDAFFMGTDDVLSCQMETGRNKLSDEMIDFSFSQGNDDDHNVKCMKRALTYRYIIATEDDYKINSDLKWMLLSQSVVLMPPNLRYTSWFMESLLEPYVHYVPIASDFSDLEKQIRWCNENLGKALQISERATLFVHDMLFDTMSDKDNSEVKFRIMERYDDNFN